GGWWDWLTPFSLLTGCGLVAGYALLGSTWLILKTEGTLQRHAVRFAWWSGAATLAAIVAVSLATPFLDVAGLEQAYFDRWLGFPDILFVAPVPLLVALASAWFVQALRT